MPAVQVVLFTVLAMLASMGIVYLLLPRLRRGGRGKTESGLASSPHAPPPLPVGMVCPACRRLYQRGLRYCPHDARALISAGDPTASHADARGKKCPMCRRSFEANKRFCPFDAEELVSASLAGSGGRMPPPLLPRALGMICPQCGQRYEAGATFCGRDGSELVNVN